MSTEPETPTIFPLTVGSVTLTAWDGFSYVDDAGRTYWSGAAEPSAEDAADALNNPRVREPENADYVAAVQAMLDARAKQDGYDHILSASTYASPPSNYFAAEGNAYLAWRSAVWAAGYAALAAHPANEPRPSVEAFLATLPGYVAP